MTFDEYVKALSEMDECARLTLRQFEQYARALFSILYDNMSQIAPTGNSREEDFPYWFNANKEELKNENASLTASNEKQKKLMGIIHEEVMTIVNEGPLAKDLQKEKESMLKDFEEDLEKNNYWKTVLSTYYKHDINYITDYKAAVEAITAETVQATLKKLVEAGNVFEVVMLP